MTKLSFCVLCLNVYIPAIVPIPPPSAVTRNNVFSEILHVPFLAFLLSNHIMKKPNIFMHNKYISMFCVVNISSILIMFCSNIFCLASFFKIGLADYFGSCLLGIRIFLIGLLQIRLLLHAFLSRL